MKFHVLNKKPNVMLLIVFFHYITSSAFLISFKKDLNPGTQGSGTIDLGLGMAATEF
jgi:hypothetical protein